jgi:hypothetical protein
MLQALTIAKYPFVIFVKSYGGYSGTGWGHGVRNLVFPSAGLLTSAGDSDSRYNTTISLETWIRLEEGETRARVLLDVSYE